MNNKALTQFIMVLIVLLVGLAASAGESISVSGLTAEQATQYQSARANYEGQFRNAVSAITSRSERELIAQKQNGVPTSELKLRKCDAEYSSVLSNRDDTGDVYIHVGFGYMNERLSITEDLIAFEKLTENLVKPCPTRRFALATSPGQAEQSNLAIHQLCGFQKSSVVFDMPGRTRLSKNISLSSGQQKRVILDIATSSFSESDYDNRHANLNQQNAKSFLASDEFYRALGNSSVVMYVGHSRDGGGPDFSLPKLKNGFENTRVVNGDPVDYEYYHRNPEKLDKMNLALSQGRHKPGIIGLFSCDSADHFYKKLDNVLDDSTRLFMTTNLTKSAFQTFLVSLNAVLSLQCQSDIAPLLNSFNATILQAH